jgi:nitroimidazol reductase NimA-like FMN-containing flavoprotein (pyridoxamine 5'-phosphate oxidase superfamily)
MSRKATFPKTKRSTIRRLPKRGSYDKDVVHGVLDQGIVCHVGLATEEGPVVIPTGYARRGDEILLHGSASSRLLNELKKGVPVCITVTLVDGLVLARSTFHHSMNYRSVVVFGRPEVIEDREEKARALESLVEHLVPGRTKDARAADEGELQATLVVRVPIEEASAKIRTGPPIDDARDLDLGIWAGVLPFERRPGQPIADEHVKKGIPFPDYLRRYPEGRT